MAKKRRRRSTGPTDRATATTTAAGRGAPEPATVKPSPAIPGGPNRQARKEEARHRREKLRRMAARRRLYRRGAWALAFLVAAGGVTGYTIYQRRATARAIDAAGCGTVRTVPPPAGEGLDDGETAEITAYDPVDQDATHIGPESGVPEPPALSTYPSVPPVSGPHLPPGQQVPSGVYDSPPDVWGAIHSLEHGAVVIWYDRDAPITDVNEIKDFFNQPEERDHVIVAPFDYPDQGEQGSLPAGNQVALTAWHHVQYCEQLSLDAAKAFVDGYRGATPNPAGYKGDAPEAGAAV